MVTLLGGGGIRAPDVRGGTSADLREDRRERLLLEAEVQVSEASLALRVRSEASMGASEEDAIRTSRRPG